MRGRRTRHEDVAPEHIAAVLRERIYGGIACLSTLLVLVRPADSSPWVAVVDVAVAAGGLWAASLLAEHVAHLAAHGKRLHGMEAITAARASGQILQASGTPLLLLVIAALGGMRYEVALKAGIWVSVVSLGLFALLAARRTRLPLWKRLLLVVALLGLGTLVVVIKTLAH
ncbi:hypothetical protein SAMN05421504_111154 [Amycolatopsis xylanica]|uniref:VIT family protein n=1 Tax=Amycolatopsis xylanica TaxID=589385 RepID=A0A1H3RKM5_9PSEU|nr:hypothetical protein [Amycolatopsis xylanica]SDZ26170.1 hypothetical protein SAMN05421504_111154 [Amycolatopsis xylanica]